MIVLYCGVIVSDQSIGKALVENKAMNVQVMHRVIGQLEKQFSDKLPILIASMITQAENLIEPRNVNQ